MTFLTKKNSRGFTLIELMVTIVVVGALAALGVPSYRRLVNKARTMEAMITLGHMHRSNQSFYSEYGIYTTNLPIAGFEMNGQVHSAYLPLGMVHNGIYTAGFPYLPNNCYSHLASTPNITNPLISETPGYLWDVNHAIVIYASKNVDKPKVSVCLPASITNDTYLMTASGRLGSGDPFTTDSSQVDQWSIDQDGKLTHVVDGTAD